jgi:hypothetical protein
MVTKKPDPQLDVIAELAEDAVPVDYPDGAPALLPILAVRPRSKRADLKRAYGEFTNIRDEIAEMQSSPAFKPANADDEDLHAERLRLWARMDDYMQKMDDVLVLAAADSDAYRVWSDAAADEDLTQTFTVWAKRAQPGEASSSSS